MKLDAAIAPLALKKRLAAFPPPTLVDVRKQQAFEDDRQVIPGAIRRAPESVEIWADALEPWRPVVVYCALGHDVGQGAAAALRTRGLDAQYIIGGLESWRAAGFATQPWKAPTRWVTRERPKIDRIACPWLVRRFVDASAEFFYVGTAAVRAFATAKAATPFDIPDVEYSHGGAQCSFDAFIRIHSLEHPALGTLAQIVRGADTGATDLAREAPGLVAASLGLSSMFGDDHAMLKWGMLVYDALYEWCRTAQNETHGWYPEKLRELERA